MATWIELVNRVWGKCTNEEADYLLWHCTAFPFASVLRVARQLKHIKKYSNGNIRKAGQIVDEEIEMAMKDCLKSE